jgi:hypothetical protein
MNLIGRRLAVLLGAVGAIAAAGPVASASAQTPTLPATTLPAFTPGVLSFVGPSAHIANVLGPTIVGAIVFEGPGAAGQVAAGAPQAISLLSTMGGGTGAFGTNLP